MLFKQTKVKDKDLTPKAVNFTIGVLIKGEKLGVIKSAYDKVMELRGKGFYVSEELLEDISRLK